MLSPICMLLSAVSFGCREVPTSKMCPVLCIRMASGWRLLVSLYSTAFSTSICTDMGGSRRGRERLYL